jgi:mannose/fructose/N-acetylgalactosamine-specific phosphotransferase system component IIC
MKQRLSNTWLHLAVGIGTAVVFAIIISVFKVKELMWFLAFTFTLITVIWEVNQWDNKKSCKDNRWLDSIVDFLAGNAGFYVVYLLILHVLKYI